jgi:hypothetical protein
MPVEGELLFSINMGDLERIISAMRESQKLGELLGKDILEHTAFAATTREYGVFALKESNLEPLKQKEFINEMARIIKDINPETHP